MALLRRETHIPTADPGAGYRAHKEEIDEAVGRVLGGGSYILGEEVSRFEREFAAFLSAGHAIGVGSGTDALQLALRVCGVGPGDVVITVSHTAVATVASIELTGATALLVDVDRSTFTMDVNRLEEAISQVQENCGKRLKAIIPVHLYGHPADMPAIATLARRHGLVVIEDCAQSHGARVSGRMTGAWGDFGAFSFYPTKNLGAFGDGGALVTSDPELASRARQLREYGWRDRYVSQVPGMNSRLDELQAAVLRVKLRHLPAENARRVVIAGNYTGRLSATSLRLPTVRPGADHVYHQYVVRHPRREELRVWLAKAGIGSLVHYPTPIHWQPAYTGRIPIGAGGLAESERLCREILSFPMHPQLTDDQVKRVADRVAGWTNDGHGNVC